MMSRGARRRRLRAERHTYQLTRRGRVFTSAAEEQRLSVNGIRRRRKREKPTNMQRYIFYFSRQKRQENIDAGHYHMYALQRTR